MLSVTIYMMRTFLGGIIPTDSPLHGPRYSSLMGSHTVVILLADCAHKEILVLNRGWHLHLLHEVGDDLAAARLV